MVAPAPEELEVRNYSLGLAHVGHGLLSEVREGSNQLLSASYSYASDPKRFVSSQFILNVLVAAGLAEEQAAIIIAFTASSS